MNVANKQRDNRSFMTSLRNVMPRLALTVTLVAGVDIGAETAKAVIFSNGQILSYSVLPRGNLWKQ